MKKRLAQTLWVLTAAFLTACGSSGGGNFSPPGGSSGGHPPSSSPSPTSAPTATPAPSVQYLVATALEPIHSAELTDVFFLDALFGTTPGGSATDYTCNAQDESRSYSSVSGPPEVIKIDQRLYYDSACSKLQTDTQQTITLTSSGSDAITTIARTTTEYNQSGDLEWTRGSSIENDSKSSNGAVQSATSASLTKYTVSGSTERTNAHSLELTQTSSALWTLTATNATLVNLQVSGRPPFAYANTGKVDSGTVSVGGTSSNPTYTYSGAHDETLYNGPIGSLSITPSTLPSTPPFLVPYSITMTSQGAEYGTATSNSSITFDASGNIIAVTVSASSNVTNLSATATFDAAKKQFTGQVTNAGQIEATFTLDVTGNGTVSYINGTSSTVQDFLISSST